MNVSEWPLVVFTILAQTAVGSFVVLGLIQLVATKRGVDRDVRDRLTDPVLYAIGPVMVLGLIASIFHLGNPINMLNVIRHVGSSWLSREIVFGSTFAGLGAAFAFCQWFKWFTPLLRQLLAGLTAIVGLGLVFVMSMVYMLPTVPAWNTWATPVSFFTTTGLLGALNVGAAFVGVKAFRQHQGAAADPKVAPLIPTTLKAISIGAIALVGVEFVVLPLYALSLATGVDAARESADVLLAHGGLVFGLRLVLAFLGAGFLGVLLYRVATAGHERLMFQIATAAFALVLVSETVGRFLFYDAHVLIGM